MAKIPHGNFRRKRERERKRVRERERKREREKRKKRKKKKKKKRRRLDLCHMNYINEKIIFVLFLTSFSKSRGG